jgi:ligand-binding SRPBCC domain-containing protein
MVRIELATRIAAPRHVCFDLARSVEFHMRSTAQFREVAVGGRTSGLLTLGEEVTRKARHFGVWQTLTSRVAAYDRPVYFRDSMVHGVVAYLDHEHRFAEDGAYTEMRDVFECAAPLGLLGRLAEILVVRAHLLRLLERRNRELKAVAEAGTWRQFVPAV